MLWFVSLGRHIFIKVTVFLGRNLSGRNLLGFSTTIRRPLFKIYISIERQSVSLSILTKTSHILLGCIWHFIVGSVHICMPENWSRFFSSNFWIFRNFRKLYQIIFCSHVLSPENQEHLPCLGVDLWPYSTDQCRKSRGDNATCLSTDSLSSDGLDTLFFIGYVLFQYLCSTPSDPYQLV